jgi:hypothetical protein
MDSNRAWLALVAALQLGICAGPARAADWTTSDGKVYQDVKLIRLDPDTVTILHKDGGAQIPLDKLSPDLQKRFGYDPELAKAAADARAKEAALNAKELQAEMDRASEMHQAGKEPAPDDTTGDSAATSDDGTGPVAQKSGGTTVMAPTPVFNTGTHHSMDEITLSGSGQKAAVDTSHRSIDDAAQSASAMRRDLSDPTYHTMAHLFYTVRQDGLRPDTTDTTHHTINETTAAANGQK